MKFALVSALIPCLSLASPIENRDVTQNFVLKNIEVETLLTGAGLLYTKGTYDIMALDRQNKTSLSSDNVPVQELKFPSQDGKLTVLDGTGKLIGTITPNQNSGFDMSFESSWLSIESLQAIPKLRSPYGSNEIAKRAPSLKNMSSRIGRYSGRGTGYGNQIAFQLGMMLGDWLFGKRDDSEETLLLPIFVQGPGVTFESFLGLGGINFSGKAISLASFGTVFVDIDNVVDFYDCDFCQFPTSSSN